MIICPFRTTFFLEYLSVVSVVNLKWRSLKKKGQKVWTAKVFLIGTDRLAKHCCNYNLISRQLAESNIPFNINNLTLYKNPVRIYISKILADPVGETVVPHFCLRQEVSKCQLERELKMLKRDSSEDKSSLKPSP